MSNFNFYEMLDAAEGFDKYDRLKRCSALFSQLMEQELQIREALKHSALTPGRLGELMVHKAELERDITREKLQAEVGAFYNPIPRAESKEGSVPKEGCCLRRGKAPAAPILK